MLTAGDTEMRKRFAILPVQTATGTVWLNWYEALYVYDPKTILGRVDGQVILFTIKHKWVKVSAKRIVNGQ